MKPIYLDYAAATPMDDLAIKAMEPFLADQFFNPSATYQAARLVKKQLEEARSIVASTLGVKDQEIVFTAGGTEANNLAINGVMQKYPNSHLIVSSIEHESVLEPAQMYDHTKLSVNDKGIVNIDLLKSKIKDNTTLVSIMYANNEIGSIQPIAKIAKLINEVRSKRVEEGNKLPIYLHTDAAQAGNYLDLQIPRLNVDLMTLNGGKIYAAKQSGVLYINKNVQLQPQITGGGQESSRRSGTENIASICSFATMLHKVQSERKDEAHRIKQLRDRLFAKLSQNINGIELNGDADKRLANNLNVLIPGVEGERLVMELDEANIMLATGSACTASSDKPSHVLLAINRSEQQASSSLRITLGRPTTEAQIDYAAKVLSQTVARHLKNSNAL